MKALSLPLSSWLAASALPILLLIGSATGATSNPLVIANDDNPFENSLTIFSIGQDGVLTVRGQVFTGGTGIAGGYFGMKRVTVSNLEAGCVYAADSFSGGIFGILITSQQSGSTTSGSQVDAGTSNGIGLALNSKYLYASFSDSGNLGTFQLQPGCTLSFVGDTTAAGLSGGGVNGMAVHDNLLVVTYTDGSIESFDVSLGLPVSNGDKQKTAGAADTATYATDIDITQDGHFAIFGDTSTSTTIEVSDLSSNKLAPTVAYRFPGSINSSNILLSSDETLLYISNTQGDTITAANFDAATGKITYGCTSRRLRRYGTEWSYLAGMALQQTEGNGGGVYVAEFGPISSVAMVDLTAGNGTCTLLENANSPVFDPNSFGLLSIARFPPRSF